MHVIYKKKVRSREVNNQVTGSYSVWLLFMFSGEADRTLFSQQDDLDQEISMIGKATVGSKEEVLISLCIICNLRVTVS